MRLVIGAALIALGLARHTAMPLIVIGVTFLVFGVASLVGAAAQRR